MRNLWSEFFGIQSVCNRGKEGCIAVDDDDGGSEFVASRANKYLPTLQDELQQSFQHLIFMPLPSCILCLSSPRRPEKVMSSLLQSSRPAIKEAWNCQLERELEIRCRLEVKLILCRIFLWTDAASLEPCLNHVVILHIFFMVQSFFVKLGKLHQNSVKPRVLWMQQEKVLPSQKFPKLLLISFFFCIPLLSLAFSFSALRFLLS